MDFALLYPPASDPRSPHLALPSLTAALRSEGHSVLQRDLDLEALLHLLLPDALGAAAQRLRRDVAAEPGTGLYDLVSRADEIVDRTQPAIRQLRDPDTFYDPNRLTASREMIARAQDLHSAANGRVAWRLGPISYEVADVDVSSLSDLARATAEPRTNLFHEFYEAHVLPDLQAGAHDVVGISITNHQQIIPGLSLARMLHEQGQLVVIGGTVFAKFADALAARPEFFELFCTAVVPHEGESALLEMGEALEAGRTLDGVANLMFLDADGGVRRGPVQVEDVDALPTPDFDGLPLDDYLAPEPVLPILTGKGCYFNRCKFCDIPSINSIADRPYRRRSASAVANDMAVLAERHGARAFEITDEALAPPFLKRIGAELSAYPDLDPRLVGYARLEPGFTPEVCAELHNMGFRKLFFGLESGSQRMLDHMDKAVRVDVAREVLRSCHDAGIGVHVFSMVGLPEETEQDARETLQFLLDEASYLSHPRHSIDLHRFNLDLRTEYFNQADQYGLVFDRVRLGSADFPLSVREVTQARGMSADVVEALLAEFEVALCERYRSHRVFPSHHYPGFEEYAVLYADRCDELGWPWRVSLPAEGDPMEFRLEWAESFRAETIEGGYAVGSILGTSFVSDAALRLLGTLPGPGDVGRFVTSMAERAGVPVDDAGFVTELRAIVDDLLGSGVLWLEPEAMS